MDAAAYKLLWAVAVLAWALILFVLAALVVERRERRGRPPPAPLARPTRPLPAVLTEWADRQDGGGGPASNQPSAPPSPGSGPRGLPLLRAEG